MRFTIRKYCQTPSRAGSFVWWMARGCCGWRDCSRIELKRLPAQCDAEKLLQAMGRELANVHSDPSSRGGDPTGFVSAEIKLAAPSRRDHGRGHPQRLEGWRK